MNARRVGRRRNGFRMRVTEFVRELLPEIQRPLTADVTDHVFCAIEANPGWLQRYHQFRNETPGGAHTVNAEIGKAVKDILATDVVGTNRAPASGLIATCSRLHVHPGM